MTDSSTKHKKVSADTAGVVQPAVPTETEGAGAVQPAPDPEVRVKAERRQYSADYKRRILQELDACSTPGASGAVLRREGLYSSHVAQWRKQRATGELVGLTPVKRGRKVSAEAVELAQLQREHAHLKARLAQAEAIIAVQKKLSELLGLSNPVGSVGT